MMFTMQHIWALAFIVMNAVGQLEWSKETTVGTPTARRDTGLQYDSTNNQLVLFGGRPGPLNDTWIYNIGTKTWKQVVTTIQPGARFSFVSGLQGNYFYVAMGEGQGKTFFSDVWRFNLNLETWEEMPDNSGASGLPESRYGSVGGIFTSGGTKLFVHQGFASRRYFDTSTYDLQDKVWSKEFCSKGCHPYSPNYPHARCLHSGTMISTDELVIFGGCLTGGSTGGPCPSGDSWYFNRKTLKWTEIDGCPSPRVYSSMANLPTVGGVRRIVLYGGAESLPQVISTTESGADEVGVLDPDEMKWTLRRTTGQNGVPSKRAGAVMTTGSTGIYMFGGADSSGSQNDLWLLSGTSATADQAAMINCPKGFVNYILLHGLFMFFGWGILLLWGGFIARYFSSSGALWFKLHVSFQVTGLVLSVIGLAFAVVSVQFDHVKFAHAIIGILIIVLGILQPINAAIRPARPKEGEKVPLKRKVWEFIHHFGGRISIVLAQINISLGLFLGLSHQAVWGLWFAYLSCVIVTFIIFEVRKCWLRKKQGEQVLDLSNCVKKSNEQEMSNNVTT